MMDSLFLRGVALDEEVAVVVMGAERVIVNDRGELYGAPIEMIVCGDLPIHYGRVRLPRYSADMSGAMQVVQRVQTLHPGWRFSLLGGDITFGYIETGPDSYLMDPTTHQVFGWRAAFFGEQDPTKPCGQRHADVWAETPEVAICRAAVSAIKSRL